MRLTLLAALLLALLCSVPSAGAWAGETGPDEPQDERTSTTSWEAWYEHNRAPLESLKKAVNSQLSDSDSPLIGFRNLSNRSPNVIALSNKTRSSVIPALLRVLAAKGVQQDLHAAAHISLGKTAQTPTEIDALMQGLDLSRKHPRSVQAAAALGLGLLRRGARARQFDGADLARVRSRLFDVVDSKAYGPRTRGTAALSIGLLGDQPAPAEGPGSHKQVTERLFHLLEGHGAFTHPDLVNTLLTSIGMQRPSSVTEFQRDVLRRCAATGKLFRGSVRTLQRSCVIALGKCGRILRGRRQIELARTLLGRLPYLKDATVRGLMAMALSEFVWTDRQRAEPKGGVLEATELGSFLDDLARRGRHAERPFGALALGLGVRRVRTGFGDATPAPPYAEFVARALDTLRKGLTEQGLGAGTRAAFALALGIARDPKSVKPLVALVANGKAEHALRSYAALSLGLIGNASRDVLVALRSARRDASAPELRVRATRALVLLGDGELVRILLEESWEADTQRHIELCMLDLAQAGDVHGVRMILQFMEDKQRPSPARALACSALGSLCDLEWLPSLARISMDLNYLASTALIRHVLERR